MNGYRILLAVSLAAHVWGEDLTGIVTDALTNRPVSGATISVVGKEISTVTNASGEYTIGELDNGPCTVRAEAAGYQSQEHTTHIGTSVETSAQFAPLAPLKGAASYDPVAGAIRITGGMSGGCESAFVLMAPDGGTVLRRTVGHEVVAVGTAGLAAGKYLWRIISADGSSTSGAFLVIQ